MIVFVSSSAAQFGYCGGVDRLRDAGSSVWDGETYSICQICYLFIQSPFGQFGL